MAQKFSFDVMSKVDLQEVLNAVDQTHRELAQRYDFKGSKFSIELHQAEHNIVMTAEDEWKLKSIIDILETRLVKRSVPLKALTYKEPEDAAGGSKRQRVDIQSGIAVEKLKEMVKVLKNSKLKVQATIMEAQLRVSGAKKDDLQAAQQALKDADLGVHMEFGNYR